MEWNFSSDRPIYLQLMEQLKLGIVSGKYPPGQRLQSVRELAAEAAVNPNTMQKALAELEREGLVYTQRTSGRFMTEDTKMIETLKTDLARESIAEFLAAMARLGFTKKETVEMMDKLMREEGEA